MLNAETRGTYSNHSFLNVSRQVIILRTTRNNTKKSMLCAYNIFKQAITKT